MKYSTEKKWLGPLRRSKGLGKVSLHAPYYSHITPAIIAWDTEVISPTGLSILRVRQSSGLEGKTS
jgi:hypothetical protein